MSHPTPDTAVTVPIHAYWVEFDRRKMACVEAASEAAALRLASEITGAKALSCKRLPYPAEPRLNKFSHPKYGVTPDFCFRPDQCAGHTYCPQNYSCTE